MLLTQEEINRNIQEINQKIDVAIFNSKGKSVSFEYNPSQQNYIKYFSTSLWGKKSFKLSGEGIILSKAIISILPNGISGKEVLQTRTKDSFFEHGNVKILIEISNGYARNRYESVYNRKIVNIINAVKQQKGIIDILARYIKDMRNSLNMTHMRIYSDGIWNDEGDKQGGQGIAFRELGMNSLNTLESKYALAIVLVDWLNNELKENGIMYYAEAYYSNYTGNCIYIRVRTIL